MHPPHIRDEILELTSLGHNDCEVARRTGVPRSSVRDIRRRAAGELRPQRDTGYCPRCWRAARSLRPEPADYAELLAMYLGDGHIVRMGRTFRLRLFLDSKYPRVVDDAEALFSRCFPANAVSKQHAYGDRMTTVSVYSCHLPCLLPQHGPGRKHERLIALEDWQRVIVDEHPWRVLRGLVRTDGCSFVNRTGRYEYLSYHFVNKSDGVIRVFEDACMRAGVRYRCNFNPRRAVWEIRINRRESVAAMVEHVGIKS